MRNFGIASRDLGRAGQMALNNAAHNGAASFSTAAAQGARWKKFAEWAKSEGIRRMEKIDQAAVLAYGDGLQSRVEAGELSAATAQNYVSAINTVMALASQGKWETVGPVHDCGISQRSGIAIENKATTAAAHAAVRNQVSERLGALMGLQRSLGLRFAESAKLDAVKALRQAMERGSVSVIAGTKGGLARLVPAASEALGALSRAAAVQGRDRSMIPVSMTYAEFQRAAYIELREAGGTGFHGERHAFAQARYQVIMGAPSPIVAGWGRAERFERLAEELGVSMDVARTKDQEAREQVAKELGHGRVEVTNAYLG